MKPPWSAQSVPFVRSLWQVPATQQAVSSSSSATDEASSSGTGCQPLDLLWQETAKNVIKNVKKKKKIKTRQVLIRRLPFRPKKKGRLAARSCGHHKRPLP
jgi:hypothetical protein